MPRLTFNRHELAGAFGDIGTDLPLIVALIAATGLNGAVVLMVFGALQILTGLVYGLPMPMQPLKAMAAIVITQKLSGAVLCGAGLTIGVAMLALSLTGALTWLAHKIPHHVVRGLQFGLGLSLASLALKEYVPALGPEGYGLAALSFVIVILLEQNRRIPAALVVIAVGLVYAGFRTLDWSQLQLASSLPPLVVKIPTWDLVLAGLGLVASQLPLSLGNSIIATEKTVGDFFPERPVTARQIGVTYGLTNIAAALVGGIPVCHGCGGLAGHHAFGARTGGSVVIYGSLYLLAGLALGDSVGVLIKAYPLPVLGVILLFESLALLRLIRDTTSDLHHLRIALLVGVIACSLKQGYLVGLVIGVLLSWFSPRERSNKAM